MLQFFYIFHNVNTFKTQFTNHKSNGLQDRVCRKVADSYNAAISCSEMSVYGSSFCVVI